MTVSSDPSSIVGVLRSLVADMIRIVGLVVDVKDIKDLVIDAIDTSDLVSVVNSSYAVDSIRGAPLKRSTRPYASFETPFQQISYSIKIAPKMNCKQSPYRN